MASELEVAARTMRQAARDAVRRHRWLYLAQAAILVVAGAFAILLPIISGIALVILLGWLLILAGLVQAFSLIGAREVPYFWLQLVPAVLSAIVGFLFLSSPVEGLVMVALLLIVALMVEGIAKIVLALTIRPLPRWGWILLSGILGIVLAIMLWSAMPGVAAWLLGLLLGMNLIGQGVALGGLALSAGGAE